MPIRVLKEDGCSGHPSVYDGFVHCSLYWSVRWRLKQLGVECAVVAPSLTPTRAGDRLKTDKRDARKLARLLRAGELTPVYIPEPTDEALPRFVPGPQRRGG